MQLLQSKTYSVSVDVGEINISRKRLNNKEHTRVYVNNTIKI